MWPLSAKYLFCFIQTTGSPVSRARSRKGSCLGGRPGVLAGSCHFSLVVLSCRQFYSPSPRGRVSALAASGRWMEESAAGIDRGKAKGAAEGPAEPQGASQDQVFTLQTGSGESNIPSRDRRLRAASEARHGGACLQFRYSGGRSGKLKTIFGYVVSLRSTWAL